MDYQIDHDPIDRGHLIVASGELDISATPRLSTVLAMAAQLDEAGTSLAVVAPEGPVRRLLEMTNLTQRFRLFATRAAALAADGAPA